METDDKSDSDVELLCSSWIKSLWGGSS